MSYGLFVGVGAVDELLVMSMRYPVVTEMSVFGVSVMVMNPVAMGVILGVVFGGDVLRGVGLAVVWRLRVVVGRLMKVLVIGDVVVEMVAWWGVDLDVVYW